MKKIFAMIPFLLLIGMASASVTTIYMFGKGGEINNFYDWDLSKFDVKWNTLRVQINYDGEAEQYYGLVKFHSKGLYHSTVGNENRVIPISPDADITISMKGPFNCIPSDTGNMVCIGAGNVYATNGVTKYISECGIFTLHLYDSNSDEKPDKADLYDSEFSITGINVQL